MPTSTGKPVRAAQMLPEERKQQLLEAGINCVAAKGIGATKHSDLARACKVSVPTVFTYFPNRESLVTSILTQVGKQFIESVITPAKAHLDPKKRLWATVPLFVQFATQEPEYVKVWLMWSMHFAPDIQKLFRKFETRLLDELAEMIKEGSSQDDPDQDIHDRARVIAASVGTMAKMVFDGVSEKRRAEFAEHILGTVLLD